MVNESLDARRLSVQSCLQRGTEGAAKKGMTPQVERFRRKK
jgi:hypothetical protein